MTHEWQRGRSQWKDQRPLGRSVHNLIVENPEWVIYVRRDLRFPCKTCYDFATGSRKTIDRNCTVCWGTGYNSVLAAVPSRIYRGSIETDPSTGTPRSDLGLLLRYQLQIAFPRAVRPKEDDVVLVVDWDRSMAGFPGAVKPRPYRLNAAYLLKTINEHFERELGWFSCGLDSVSLDYRLYEDLIPQMGDLSFIDTEKTWRATSYW